MHVSEWMTSPVLTIKPKDTIRQARELMMQQRINQLPVVVDDKLRGILTDRDTRDAYPSSTSLVRSKKIDAFADSHIVEEAMTYNVVTISPQTSIREAAECLRKQRFGSLPVVEGHTLVGIITRSDVLDALLSTTKGDE